MGSLSGLSNSIHVRGLAWCRHIATLNKCCPLLPLLPLLLAFSFSGEMSISTLVVRSQLYVRPLTQCSVPRMGWVNARYLPSNKYCGSPISGLELGGECQDHHRLPEEPFSPGAVHVWGKDIEMSLKCNLIQQVATWLSVFKCPTGDKAPSLHAPSVCSHASHLCPTHPAPCNELGLHNHLDK